MTLITQERRYTTSSDFKKRPNTGSGVTRRSSPSISPRENPANVQRIVLNTKSQQMICAFDCTFLQLGKVDASKDQIKMDSQFHDVFVQAHWRLCHCQQNLTSYRCQSCRMISEIHSWERPDQDFGEVPSKTHHCPPSRKKNIENHGEKTEVSKNHGAQIKKITSPFKGWLLSPPLMCLGDHCRWYFHPFRSIQSFQCVERLRRFATCQHSEMTGDFDGMAKL